MPTDTIRLCVPTLKLDADVLKLYQSAFPVPERESVGRLSELLDKGLMLCHRTLNDQGQLLCFSIVTLADTFSFLAYMATDPERRSAGIGSQHLERLQEILQELHPDHIGLFFEIEATDPKAEVLEEKEQIIRNRRRKFYERAGARVICPNGVYLTPHYNDRNKEWEGELMGFEFGEAVTASELMHILEQVYALCYQLPKDHPLVTKVFRNFGPCIDDGGQTGAKTEAGAGDTAVGAHPAADHPAALAEDDEDSCGCAGRRDAIMVWLSGVWARLRALLGLD